MFRGRPRQGCSWLIATIWLASPQMHQADLDSLPMKPCNEAAAFPSASPGYWELHGPQASAACPKGGLSGTARKHAVFQTDMGRAAGTDLAWSKVLLSTLFETASRTKPVRGKPPDTAVATKGPSRVVRQACLSETLPAGNGSGAASMLLLCLTVRRMFTAT